MRVLVIGGAGRVASLILPTLARQHQIRIFDRKPPGEIEAEYVQGEATDFKAVVQAAAGCDALLYMAMGRYISIGTPYAEHVEALTTSVDANIKGVYIALYAARHAGIEHAVYTSSMSIYDERSLTTRYFHDEEVPPDACDSYGFTKRLGEMVCQNACRDLGMSVNALRLCWPVSDSRWQEIVRDANGLTLATAESDLSRAVHAALTRRFGGYQVFMLSGDYEQKIMNMSKAKRMLDWEPLARPVP
jgi:nucleoside-diphosphate-sugar epimerase